MFKAGLLLIALATAFNVCSADKKPIYPLVGEEFGVPIKIKGKLARTQDKTGASYSLKIIEISGTKLAEPITIECAPFDTMITGKKLSKASVEEVYEIVGYESASMDGLPNGVLKLLPNWITPHMTGWETKHLFVVLDITNIP